MSECLEEKNMKKLIALLLALVMVVGLIACGNTKAPAETKAPAAETPEEILKHITPYLYAAGKAIN